MDVDIDKLVREIEVKFDAEEFNISEILPPINPGEKIVGEMTPGEKAVFSLAMDKTNESGKIWRDFLVNKGGVDFIADEESYEGNKDEARAILKRLAQVKEEAKELGNFGWAVIYKRLNIFGSLMKLRENFQIVKCPKISQDTPDLLRPSPG